MKNVLLTITALALSLASLSQAPGGVSSGLAIWLKADAGTSSSTNGAFLSSWNDQSGNGINATQSDPSNTPRPRFATNIMNGNPAIEFNGGGKFFNINLSSLGTEYTIITVLKRIDNGTLRYVIGVQSTLPRGLHLGYVSNTSLRMSEGAATSNADATVTGYAGASEVPAIVMGENLASGGRTVTEIKDGTTVSATNVLGAIGPGMTNGVIGRGFTTSGFSGYLVEAIMYNRNLTATEKASINTYLSVKYGLTIAVTEHDYYDDATYSFDLFGIGRNTTTQGLNQTTSSSENPDDMVQFSSPSSLDNGDYLVSGNNNGALTFAAYGGSNCTIASLLNRRWKVEETGETGTTTVRFDLTSLSVSNPEELLLYVDNDGDGFDDETPIEGVYAAPFLTFSGVNFADNSYYTLGEGVATWYSRASGNVSDAIWSKTATGTAQAITTLCSRINIVIQAGHTITNDVTITARNFSIANTANFTQNNLNVTLHGTYVCNGTHSVGTGNVNFNGTVSQSINGTGIPEFHNVNCNNASGVSIAGTGLRVKGVLQVNSGVFSTNGKLTLVSNAANTGSIGPLTTGDLLGNVTIQRYHNATSAGWVNIGSPIQSKTVSDWNDDMITTGFTGSDYPNYNFNNIQYYNESAPGNRNQGFVGVTSLAEVLASGRGYFIYMNAGLLQLDVDGSIFKGAQTLPVTFTNNGDVTADGWSLVANPYPSAIDWDNAGWTKTNMNNAVHVWNAAIAQYSTYINGVGANGGTGIIPSSQSFYVQANAASPTLAVSESVKTSNIGSFKSLRTDAVTSIQIKMGDYTDETVLVWDENASSIYENDKDGFKLESQINDAPYLSTVSSDGFDLSISNMNLQEEEFIIPVKIESALGGKTVISWKGAPEVEGYEMIFEDLLHGHAYNMNETKSFLAEIKANRTDARFQIRWKKKDVPSAIEPTKGGVSGMLTADGIQLTFDYDQEYQFKITAYNMLGQQLTESFVGNYSKNVITFSDDVYGAHSLVDVINMTTGERTTIRLGK